MPTNKGLPNIKTNLGKSLRSSKNRMSVTSFIASCKKARGNLSKIVVRKGELSENEAEIGFQFSDESGRNEFMDVSVSKDKNGALNSYSQVALIARSLGMDNVDPLSLKMLPAGQHHITSDGVKTTKKESKSNINEVKYKLAMLIFSDRSNMERGIDAIWSSGVNTSQFNYPEDETKYPNTLQLYNIEREDYLKIIRHLSARGIKYKQDVVDIRKVQATPGLARGRGLDNSARVKTYRNK